MMAGYKVGMKVLVLSIVLGAVAAAGRPSKLLPAVPAVYVLGDSTLDVGNNNFLTGEGVPRADRPFYGIDLPGYGMPTGRFSNGHNIADFVAKHLGFKESPLPYLELKAQKKLVNSALTRGVSYASAGCGILDSTNAGNNIPLSQQVRQFESTKAEMEAKVGPSAASKLISNSFFLIGAGSNDFFAIALAPPQGRATATKIDVAAFYGSLVSNYSTTITELYKLGARKIGIINVGTVGCVPFLRVFDATGACIDDLNQLAAGFNAAFKPAMAGLAPKLPGLAYSIADSFAVAESTFANLTGQGFVNDDSACCGVGRLGVEDGDCSPAATLCADRGSYVFWDGAHPSQRATMLEAQAYFDGPAQYSSPITFKQLASIVN